MSEAAAAAEWPGGLTLERVHEALEKLLGSESWETLTMKVILAKLEASLLPQHPPGTLKPFKKLIKEKVDTLMRQMLPAFEAAKSAAAETETAAPTADQATTENQAEKRTMDSAPVEDAHVEEAGDAPAGKRQRVGEEEEATEEAAGAVEPAPEEPAKEGDAAKDDDEMGGESDFEDDPDAPRVVGKPTHKMDGKTFYTRMTKGDQELRVGQDVYLENNQDEPYKARLQEIFTYSFAPSEVYFNARWYYSVSDVHEYAKMSGAKGDVEYDGEVLTAEPKELFFSLHTDENHADCILRPCTVHLVRVPQDEPPALMWEDVMEMQHEYVAWRAYDNKHVYSLASLPSKKLKDAADLEVKRSPQDLQRRVTDANRSSARDARAIPTGPLQDEEFHSIYLPRKYLEVWLETNSFSRVTTGTLVRCSQLVNNVRTYFVGYVMQVKRAPRPYKLGQKIADVALQVRTHIGNRLVGLDALSNEPITPAEMGRFKVALDPEAVRKKILSLQRAMQEDANLFEEDDMKRRYEQEERLRKSREEEKRREEKAEAEKARKERERDEARRRAAAQKQQESTEAWWLQYQRDKPGDKAREIAKVKARLMRFRKIASTSEAEGERQNALRLAEQAEEKLRTLEAQE